MMLVTGGFFLKHFVVLFIGFSVATTVWAQVPSFDSLSNEDLSIIVDEMSANFIHTSASSPSSPNKIFSIEAGVLVGATQTKGIEELSQRQSSDIVIPAIPHFWIVTSVYLPLGFSAELNGLPEFNHRGLSFRHFSGAVRWSITDGFASRWPIDIAGRVSMSNSRTGFAQEIDFLGSPTDVNVGYAAQTFGADVLVGLDADIFRPYIGLGYAETMATVTGEAEFAPSYSIFNTGQQSKDLERNSLRMIAGFELTFLLLNTSIEYSNVFGIHRASFKLGLAF